MAPLAVATVGAASQTDAVAAAPPSAIERALTERACTSLPSAAFADADAHQRCADAQLALLRTDFGPDLRRLSAAERRGLDAACSHLETTHGRESYLDCVNAQLIGLRVRRGRPKNAAASASASPPLAEAAAASSAPPAPSSVESAPPSHAASSMTAIAGVALLTIAGAAAGSLLVLRKQSVHRTCRHCGAGVADSGDFCAACRHAAADALRRAASERMDQVRAEEAERRRKTQVETEEGRQVLREEDARLREREEDQRRAENARRAQEEQARRQSTLGAARASASAPPREDDEEFDPYAVLGVPRDTTPDEIRAAWEQARSKYDQDSVAHLGIDVQERFREKAQAVDRAYHILLR